MAGAYYNERDPYAAAWLRNLIAAGHIADGEVDQRDIREVTADDVRGFTQCHFFAGIAGWSDALRLAGWPDDAPVWTGSCPCQPFSVAGRGEGFADERHLWPDFFRLISECRPPVVFGEQVASKAADAWLDAVQADLEGVGYALGAVPVPAAGIGAPHIRDRLWWVADASQRGQREQRHAVGAGQGRHADGGGDASGGMADAECLGRVGGGAGQAGDGRGRALSSTGGFRAPGIGHNSRWPSPLHGFWRDADWLLCRDGKWRPVEPGTFPLAHGIPARVGRLRAYGNAIVPPLAAEFIAAFMEASHAA